jgi:hypothetical protein
VTPPQVASWATRLGPDSLDEDPCRIGTCPNSRAVNGNRIDFGPKKNLPNYGVKIPFAPFVGLDILDDAIGDFQLEYVAWDPKSKIFLCQSRTRLPHLSVRQFCARLKAAGWVREKSDDDVWARQSKSAGE